MPHHRLRQARGLFVQLLGAARRGSSSARGALLDRCRGRLLPIARRLLPSDLRRKADASDLVQDTLLEAHRDFHQFRGATEEQFHGWVREILANTFRNFLRTYRGLQKRRVSREQPLGRFREPVGGGVAPGCPSPADEVIRAEESRAVRCCLELLPPHYRQALLLRFFQRLPFREVGCALGLSGEAARKLCSRALAELSRALRAGCP